MIDETLSTADGKMQKSIQALRRELETIRTGRATPVLVDSINVDAKVGRLAIFPAWLKHSVGPNNSDAERISISLNMMFSDFTKRVSRPLWKGV